jgi:type VI secretion system protein ImpJ
MKSQLQRVVWAKGMLLTPQHFQSHENYIEDTLHFRFQASSFANWGLLEAGFDEEALVNGQLGVTRFRGILPDGTPVDCPGTDPAPPARPFAQNFPPSDDFLDVYLAIPERRQGQNVALTTNGDRPQNLRYTARVSDVRDENGLDEDKAVQFAERNLLLLTGNQRADGHVRMRIGQLCRTSTGQFALNQEFIPPLLDVGSNKTLMGILKRLIEILGTTSQSLSSTRRQRGKGLADFNVSETASFWLLHTVNSCLPELVHIWGARRGHPEPVYVAMLRLAGALSTFSFKTDIRTLPQYDHDDLATCFGAVDARIRDLLEEMQIQPKCITVPLRQNQRTWSGNISDESWLRNTQLYVGVSGDAPVDEIIRRAPQVTKVANSDEINNLISHALPGLTLRHIESPPSAIPFRMGTQYFAVSQGGRLWDGITRARSIAIYIPPELPKVVPELFILLP